jgi:hypothetical protein
MRPYSMAVVPDSSLRKAISLWRTVSPVMPLPAPAGYPISDTPLLLFITGKRMLTGTGFKRGNSF